LHSSSAATLRSATQNWCGPLLAKGATCTMGCVYEPYLQFTPNIAFFLSGWGGGYTFGEAAWAAQPALSWQTTVVGDPLYQPFKKSPPELHGLLARTKNPLIEWSFDRLVCLDLARGVRGPQITQFLENLPATPQSAVLTEKLASLYDAAGKPSSAIETWQKALELKPSPQQRLRLRLTLGEKLVEQGDDAAAIDDYKQLLKEMPDYPGKSAVEEKLKALEPKPADTNAPAGQTNAPAS
ncbi:MAG: TIGR03790 family protein, partial [Verrucomicrobiota bacterium]